MSKSKIRQYKLNELINYYQTCNQSEGKSPKTITFYTNNLNNFQRYLKNRRFPDSLNSIDIKLLREYITYLLKRTKYQDHPYTPARPEPLSLYTIHCHVRTLRAFFSWLLREDLIENNIAKNLKPPKLPQKIIATLSDEEIQSIIRIFDIKCNMDARNQVIFMLLLDTGLRIGELINIKMGDVHIDEGFIKVLGKGNKERLVPVGNNARKAIQRYIFRFRPAPANMQVDNVFLKANGQPVTEDVMKLMFTRLAKRSGITRLHAHLCRHTFATRFLINGGDIAFFGVKRPPFRTKPAGLSE